MNHRADLLLIILALAVVLFIALNQPARAATPMANRSPLVFRPVTVPALVDRLPGPSPTRSAVLGITTELQSERRPVSGQTTRRSLALSGVASWYCCTAGYAREAVVAAAGPALRVGDWRGRIVTVCARICARVRLVDWCQCYRGTSKERVIDLAVGALAALDLDPDRGLYHVEVSW